MGATIASTTETKLVRALGFEQCAHAYQNEINAAPEQIETHHRYLARVLDDDSVKVAPSED